MLDRIGALMGNLHQVSSDVAHDLRTPLSRLYQHPENACTHPSSVAAYEVAVDDALREAEGLLEIFPTLLRIAQVEGASPPAGFRDVDLSVGVDSVADAYQPDAEDAGHTLVAEAARGVVIHADQELLTQAAANLVENALRHTPAGTWVGIRLSQNADGSCLRIDDDGPGAGTADLPRLTHRFYRGGHSRTTPGNGLGSSLGAALAGLRGARLRLDGTQPGLRASLLFPPAQGMP